MALYENALAVYNSRDTLHAGTTFSHRYKAILAQARRAIRQIGGADTMQVVAAWERELDRIDIARKGLEDKLLAVYPGMVNVLKAMSGDSRRDMSVALGDYDAETDGVGVLMLNNLLELQGSEALAVKRVKELIRTA